MTESNSPSSANISLRVKTLAAELPDIDIPASATVLQLKRRIAQHLELQQPYNKHLKLTHIVQDKGVMEPVLLIDREQLDNSFVPDGADLILTIEDLPEIDEFCRCDLESSKTASQMSRLLARHGGALDFQKQIIPNINIFVGSLSIALMPNTTITSLNLEQNRYRGYQKNSHDHCVFYDRYVDNQSSILRDGSTIKLADALQYNTTLTELNLKNHLIGLEGVNAIKEMLLVNKTLQSLFLSDNEQIKQSECIDRLVAAACNSSITALGIAGFSISDSAVSTLLALDSKISRLELNVMKSDRHISELLQQNTIITELELRFPGKLEVKSHLFEIIATNTTITSIGLSTSNCWMECTAASARLLADALKRNTAITVIYLQHNSFSEADCKAIACVLAQNPRIVKLSLFSSEMSEKGLLEILLALTSTNTLESNLQELDLGGDIKIIEKSAYGIASMLESNTTLTKLGLNQNCLEIDGLQIICDALKQNTTLKSIDLRDCRRGQHYYKDVYHATRGLHGVRPDLKILR